MKGLGSADKGQEILPWTHIPLTGSKGTIRIAQPPSPIYGTLDLQFLRERRPQGKRGWKSSRFWGLLPTKQAACSLTALLSGPREHLSSPHFHHQPGILKSGTCAQCAHKDLSFCLYNLGKKPGLFFFLEHGFHHLCVLKWERMKVRKYISGPFTTCCTMGVAPWKGQKSTSFPQRTNHKHPVGKFLSHSQ